MLGETPSVISSHLALLRAAQVVSRETYGSYAYYNLAQGALSRYTQYLEQLTSSPIGEEEPQS